MKKKALSFYCITLMLFCQILLCCDAAGALSENGSSAISDNCDQVKTLLRNVQHSDSRTRVYIGGYYEKFLSKFIKPLNLRLVNNNVEPSDVTNNLISNQNSFATAQINFKDDFIEYQKSLEELINSDCKSHPQDFYNLLVTVREKRQTMVSDIAKATELIQKHVELVRQLKGTL